MTLRITGGVLRGRRLTAPARGVRPSQERVREALFSILAPKIRGARVLDLFAGSGALGLEAWSRGARSVWWVEENRQVFETLRRNVKELCAGGDAEARCVKADALKFLAREGMAPFDLILADPPYDVDGRRKWAEISLRALEEHPMLAADGIVAFERGASEPSVRHPGWMVLVDRTYGDSRLTLFVRPSPFDSRSLL